MKSINRSDLPALLSPLGGGFFFGLLNINDQLRALIVANKAEGEFEDVPLGTFGNRVEGADSFFDGLSNTNALAAAGSAVAEKVRALRIGDCDDWHIPARDALELMYRLGKPTARKNWPYRGDNPSSVPVGYPYTPDAPGQCENPLFRTGGAEAFAEDLYWSSTQYSAHRAWGQYFGDGDQYYDLKDYEGRVRAVRTIHVIN